MIWFQGLSKGKNIPDTIVESCLVKWAVQALHDARAILHSDFGENMCLLGILLHESKNEVTLLLTPLPSLKKQKIKAGFLNINKLKTLRSSCFSLVSWWQVRSGSASWTWARPYKPCYMSLSLSFPICKMGPLTVYNNTCSLLCLNIVIIKSIYANEILLEA